jgi:hypothetical protein
MAQKLSARLLAGKGEEVRSVKSAYCVNHTRNRHLPFSQSRHFQRSLNAHLVYSSGEKNCQTRVLCPAADASALGAAWHT